MAGIDNRLTRILSGVFCIFIVLTVLQSCSNPLSALIGEAEDQAREASGINAPDSRIASGSALTSIEDLVFTFDQAIVSGSLVLGGDMAASSDTPEWSTVTYSNDTLTLSPVSAWPTGMENIILSCEAADGRTLSSQSYTFQVFHGMCVDDGASATGADGSAYRPYNDIQDGIDEADTVYVSGGLASAAEVRVAEGTYTESCVKGTAGSAGTHVAILEPGISLLGGWDHSFTSRDITSSGRASTIQDTGTSAGSFLNPVAPVYCGSGITSTSTISGFTIYPATDSELQNRHTAGILSESGAAPTIEYNTITTGTNRNDSVAGIALRDSLATVQNNDLGPLRAEEDTIGIFSFTGSASTEGPEISGNTLDSAGSNSSGGTYGSIGIWILQNDAYIHDNTIRVNYGQGSRSGVCFWGVGTGQDGPRIEDNDFEFIYIINVFGIYEYDADSDPATVSGNSFSARDVGFYNDEGTTPVIDDDWDTYAISTGSATDTLPNLGNTRPSS